MDDPSTSTDDDPRMLAFFDSLVQREINGLGSINDGNSSERISTCDNSTTSSSGDEEAELLKSAFDSEEKSIADKRDGPRAAFGRKSHGVSDRGNSFAHRGPTNHDPVIRRRLRQELKRRLDRVLSLSEVLSLCASAGLDVESMTRRVEVESEAGEDTSSSVVHDADSNIPAESTTNTYGEQMNPDGNLSYRGRSPWVNSGSDSEEEGMELLFSIQGNGAVTGRRVRPNRSMPRSRDEDRGGATARSARPLIATARRARPSIPAGEIPGWFDDNYDPRVAWRDNRCLSPSSFEEPEILSVVPSFFHTMNYERVRAPTTTTTATTPRTTTSALSVNTSATLSTTSTLQHGSSSSSVSTGPTASSFGTLDGAQRTSPSTSEDEAPSADHVPGTSGSIETTRGSLVAPSSSSLVAPSGSSLVAPSSSNSSLVAPSSSSSSLVAPSSSNSSLLAPRSNRIIGPRRMNLEDPDVRRALGTPRIDHFADPEIEYFVDPTARYFEDPAPRNINRMLAVLNNRSSSDGAAIFIDPPPRRVPSEPFVVVENICDNNTFHYYDRILDLIARKREVQISERNRVRVRRQSSRDLGRIMRREAKRKLKNKGLFKRTKRRQRRKISDTATDGSANAAQTDVARSLAGDGDQHVTTSIGATDPAIASASCSTAAWPDRSKKR